MSWPGFPWNRRATQGSCHPVIRTRVCPWPTGVGIGCTYPATVMRRPSLPSAYSDSASGGVPQGCELVPNATARNIPERPPSCSPRPDEPRSFRSPPRGSASSPAAAREAAPGAAPGRAPLPRAGARPQPRPLVPRKPRALSDWAAALRVSPSLSFSFEAAATACLLARSLASSRFRAARCV